MRWKLTLRLLLRSTGQWLVHKVSSWEVTVRLRRALRRLATGLALATSGLAATMVVPASPADAAPPVPSGIYRIVNAGNSLCLGARSFTPGRTIVVERRDNPTNEVLRRWVPQNLDGGVDQDGFSLVKVNSNLCLHGNVAGGEAFQWLCNGISDQRWRFVPL